MTYVFDQCELDLEQVELRVRGQPRSIEPQVFDVLAYLVAHRDRMVPKEELLDEVWQNRFVSDSAISSRIKSARRAIGDDGRAQRLIRTVHGRGFQFVGDARAVERVSGRRSPPVPQPLTPTIGRERDIEGVQRLLDRARIVTLLGPGGVGKTRLAAAVALRRSEATGTEACFIDLTRTRDPRLVPELIVRELGIHAGVSGDMQPILAEVMRGRSLLLVLDNFEHVVAAADTVTDLVRASPGVQVLATSRARLRIAGEHVFDVAPLSLDASDGGPGDAVALFEQAATAVDLSFRIEPNLADVVAICRTVDGLPLGIELAAGQVRALPPALLRSRLGARLGSPSGATRDAPPRQRTIPAMIDWSLHLLGAAEQRLFACLGVFNGPVPLEAVEQVCADPGGDVVEALSRLVDQSLVRRTTGVRGQARFGLLELLRQRARELLAARDDADTIAQRHAAYVAGYVEDLEERRWTDATDRWIDLVTELMADICAAHAWAADRGEAELATRITANLGNFWYRAGHHVDGRDWVADALAHHDELDPLLAAKLRLTAGFVEWPHGEVVARRHWEAAVAGFRALGHDRYLAYCTALLSVTYVHESSHYDLAVRLCVEAIELAERVGEAPLLASTYNVKGELARVHGDDVMALRAYEEGMQFATAARDAAHTSVILGDLSFLARHRGDYAEAGRLGREALRLSWSVGRRTRAASALTELAGSELGLGRPDQGARLLGAGYEAMRALQAQVHPCDRPEHDRIGAGLRAALGEDAFLARCAEGAALSLDQAVRLALSAPGNVDAAWPPSGPRSRDA